MFGRVCALLAAFTVAVPSGAASLEAPRSFRADYSISLYGLPIAWSTFTSKISGNTFHVQGSLSSAGIARIIDNTKATTSVSGRFANGGIRPESYLVNYTSGKKKKKTEIAFAGGNVVRTENVPPPRKRGKWIHVGKSHLRSVADPLSATLVRADSPAEVCNRTLKIYDGEMRADLVLSHVAIKPVVTGGYQGEAVTCSARFIPVAGYREGHKSLEFLRNKSKITIAFAPLGTTGVYAPVQAFVGTEIGTIRIEASRFGPAG